MARFELTEPVLPNTDPNAYPDTVGIYRLPLDFLL
jgi:hypothetical protein